MRILFVCLGNICRSPTAESVFRSKAAQVGLKHFFFDSAGTIGHHIGESSDHRSIRHARLRGYEMTHKGRQLCEEDFDDFDLILTMDSSNFKNTLKICPQDKTHKIKMVTDFCSSKKYDHVPDPYYGNEKDFELVIDILEEAATGFFKSI